MAGSAGPRLDEFNAQSLANIAWAYAKAGHVDEALFTFLARAANPRLVEFALATSQLDEALFAAMAGAAERALDRFIEPTLRAACWTFARRESLIDA